jgi:hypothetical protein
MPENEATELDPSASFTRCPPPLALAEPHPSNLTYSLTLPSATATPAIAHEIAEIVLDTHGVADLMEPALLLVRELTAYACRFTTAGEEIYLGLRQCENTLRLTVFDSHPRHRHPRLLASCDALRRATLRLTPKLVSTHHGTWGFRPAQHPGAGTSTWATLART